MSESERNERARDHLRRVAEKLSHDEREHAADDLERANTAAPKGWHKASGPGSTNISSADWRGTNN